VKQDVATSGYSRNLKSVTELRALHSLSYVRACEV
jgi:hypothetical protein